MLGLLILLAAGQVPGQPRAEPPRVVVVSMRGCQPCEDVKRALAPLNERSECDVYIEDVFSWNRRVVDALRVNVAPTVFVWPDPGKPGYRIRHDQVTLKRVEDLLGLTAGSE